MILKQDCNTAPSLSAATGRRPLQAHRQKSECRERLSGACLMLVPPVYLIIKRVKPLYRLVTRFVPMRTLLAWHIYAAAVASRVRPMPPGSAEPLHGAFRYGVAGQMHAKVED
jgi:hypothetical protein